MRVSGEYANLELETGTIALVAGQEVSMTFTQSINLRVTLGDMYNNYNKFLIVFNGIGAFVQTIVSYSSGSTTNQQGLVWTLGMSGDIRFLNNTVNGNNSIIGYFPTRFSLPSGALSFLATNSTTNNGLTFHKPPNDIVTFTVAPYLIRGGAPATILATATSSYDMNLGFSIYGLSE